MAGSTGSACLWILAKLKNLLRLKTEASLPSQHRIGRVVAMKKNGMDPAAVDSIDALRETLENDSTSYIISKSSRLRLAAPVDPL